MMMILDLSREELIIERSFQIFLLKLEFKSAPDFMDLDLIVFLRFIFSDTT